MISIKYQHLLIVKKYTILKSSQYVSQIQKVAIKRVHLFEGFGLISTSQYSIYFKAENKKLELKKQF